MKVYKCEKCGKIIEMINDVKVPTVCCGQPMNEIVPGTTEAATEKHIPVYEVNDNVVDVVVGSTLHPMSEEHYIEWIVLETKQGIVRKMLKPNEAPKASFTLTKGDEIVAVYAYCNLHSLWKA